MLRGLSWYNLVNWYKMLVGKSIYHVNQGPGQCYAKDGVRGYYNDLTEKVLKAPEVGAAQVPRVKTQDGKEIIFPIAVFQYGLGAYDLYLLHNEAAYQEKFQTTAQWALDNQEQTGAWSNFFFIYPESPYSAMAQGEGASLLLRAYLEYGDEGYLRGAKKAIEFMLKPLEEGGTALYKNGEIFFQEFTNKPTVLNGWIFAIFGLYDYVKVSGEPQTSELLEKTLRTLEGRISDFDSGYWSMYNRDGMITSPFYHRLHIAQLTVLYDLFGIPAFAKYSGKWSAYQGRLGNRAYAFIKKAAQKLTEK